MANTGMSDLALVAPRRLDMEEANKMACHATDILEERSTYDSLREATGDCGVIVGTSAREGLYPQHARPPREWAPHILKSAARGRVALVFGREDKGLSNEELAICTQIIQIPTSPSYTSLNLAQAVLICCHEVFVATGIYEPPEEKSPLAEAELRERMFEMWRDTMLKIGFMEEEKADHMMQGFRRIMGRGAETTDDVRIMMGLARQAEWAADKERCAPVIDRGTGQE